MAIGRTQNIFFGSRTDVGHVRERNEDSLAAAPPLFIVADGMGGHRAGDVASEVAVNACSSVAPSVPDVDLLGRAVEVANHAVMAEAQTGDREGMGTTMTAAVVEGDKIAIAHVGDSRAYLLHGDKLQQLTRDHSWVADMVEKGQITPEEARVHPNRSVITRALGSDPNMQPDLYEITASGGDRLLLCSDGLYSMIPDTEIERTLREVREPRNCANALVKAALDAGGTDNVTVIVVAIAGDAPRRERRERFRGRTWMALVLIAVAFVLAAGAVGFYSWVHNSAYLAERDGKVVIYQGVPEDFPGIETHWLYRITDVEVSSLQPSAQAHLREGIRKDNLESAEQLVEEYQRQAHDSPSSVVGGVPDDSGASSSTSVSASSSQGPSESK